MDFLLHKRKYDFSKKINQVAFEKKLKPSIVERQYYFSLFKEVCKLVFPKISIPEFKQSNYETTILGNYQAIIQSYWDWVVLVNFVKNYCRKLDLIFSFVEKQSNIPNTKALSGTLYYTRIDTEVQESISFTFIGENNTQPDSDSDSSGGTALAKIKLDENDLDKFLSKFKNQIVRNQEQKIKTSSKTGTYSSPTLKNFKYSKIEPVDNIICSVTNSITKNNSEFSPVSLKCVELVSTTTGIQNQQYIKTVIKENSNNNDKINQPIESETLPLEKQITPTEPTKNPGNKIINADGDMIDGHGSRHLHFR